MDVKYRPAAQKPRSSVYVSVTSADEGSMTTVERRRIRSSEPSKRASFKTLIRVIDHSRTSPPLSAASKVAIIVYHEIRAVGKRGFVLIYRGGEWMGGGESKTRRAPQTYEYRFNESHVVDDAWNTGWQCECALDDMSVVTKTLIGFEMVFRSWKSKLNSTPPSTVLSSFRTRRYCLFNFNFLSRSSWRRPSVLLPTALD